MTLAREWRFYFKGYSSYGYSTPGLSGIRFYEQGDPDPIVLGTSDVRVSYNDVSVTGDITRAWKTVGTCHRVNTSYGALPFVGVRFAAPRDILFIETDISYGIKNYYVPGNASIGYVDDLSGLFVEVLPQFSFSSYPMVNDVAVFALSPHRTLVNLGAISAPRDTPAISGVMSGCAVMALPAAYDTHKGGDSWGAIQSIPETSVLSSIQGVQSKRLDVSGAFKSYKTFPYEIPVGVKSLSETSVLCGMLGMLGCQVSGAIQGGDADLFQKVIPLSTLVPLRLTSVWHTYLTVEAIQLVYGVCWVKAIQYDTSGKVFVTADHAISGVLQVMKNGLNYSMYEMRNGEDSTGKTVGMIILNEGISQGDEVYALIQGKMHPLTGELLTNPADVVWDFLANVMNAGYSYSDFSYLRNLCKLNLLTLNGQVKDEKITVRALIDIWMSEIGAIWSMGMTDFAKLYP